jgi:hypothetical protein
MKSDILNKLRSLEDDLRDYVERSRPLPIVLEERRLNILTTHLGYNPATPCPVVYVVGDSHSAFFSGAETLIFHKVYRVFTGFFRVTHINVCTELLPVFRVFHLGAATAWQAASKGSSERAYEKLNVLLRKKVIPKGATILLVFGEIDIRCHIPKAILSGKKSMEEAVNATVDRFLKLPIDLKKRGYLPAIWLPSLNAKRQPTEDIENTASLPAIGPQSLRDEITRLYCNILKEKASACGLKTSGLSTDVSVPEEDRYLDSVHLSQNLMPKALEVLIADGILAITPAL